MNDSDLYLLFLANFANALETNDAHLFADCTNWPEYCSPMSRDPSPPTGIPFDLEFSQVYATEYSKNPSIHDGAIVTLEATKNEWMVQAWSCRLYPPEVSEGGIANVGSAHNSAMNFSLVGRVKRVIVTKKNELLEFREGTLVTEHSPSTIMSRHAERFGNG